MTWIVEPFDHRAATEDDLRARYELFLAEHAEEFPEDPVTPFEAWHDELVHRPSWVRDLYWNVWDEARTRVLGAGGVELAYRDTNRHLAWFRIYVRPEYRRQRIATALLERIVDVARADERTVLGSYSVDPGPGVGWMEAAGAERKATERKSRLVLADVDREMLEEWVRRAKERASDYSLIGWDGRVPDEYLDRWLRVVDVMNTAPRDDLDMEDWHHTPETWREREALRAAQGHTSWTLVCRHDPTGDLAGFTEFHFSPHHPDAAWQMGTATDPAHRNKGIGRWLKAANCLRLLDQRPEARFVDTWNAFSNDAMLGINVAMGFHLVRGFADYQAPIDVWARAFTASKAF